MKNKQDEDNMVVLDLLCGDRRIICKEYNTLAKYNNLLCKTEFGAGKLKRLLKKYTILDNRYEDALNFITEENLKGFVWECRTYLKI